MPCSRERTAAQSLALLVSVEGLSLSRVVDDLHLLLLLGMPPAAIVPPAAPGGGAPPPLPPPAVAHVLSRITIPGTEVELDIAEHFMTKGQGGQKRKRA